MSCGRRLGLARVNAQAYAGDVVILSPTLTDWSAANSRQICDPGRPTRAIYKSK